MRFEGSPDNEMPLPRELELLLKRPSLLVLVKGETGMGKTTAALERLGAERTSRPLLSRPDPLGELRRLFQARHELYEAADLDGAGPVRQFVHVTLPMLAPTFLFIGVITMIGYFQLFAEPYVMTGGGPLRATTSLVLLMYEEGFRWWRMGVAAAVAFILFLIILAWTLLQFRLQKERG